MSKFLLMRDLFLVYVGTGCQALHLSLQTLGDQASEVSEYRNYTSGCVTWHQAGRLGNKFSGLADALFEAEMCGRPCVASSSTQQEFFRQLFDLPPIITLVDPFSKKDDTDLCRQAVAHRTRTAGYIADLPPMNWTKWIFNKHLSPLLKRSMVIDAAGKDDTLIVHLRGGDVLLYWNAYYMPAPCAFYQHVIRYGNKGKEFKDVVVVSDDANHPCLSMIDKDIDRQTQSITYRLGDPYGVGEDATKTHIEGARLSLIASDSYSDSYLPVSAADDFMLLASGKNIALSTSSSFGMSAVMMNPHEQIQIFMPTYAGETLSEDGNFNLQRLAEICSIGQGSKIFEFPFPHGYNKTHHPEGGFSWPRIDWLKIPFIINASTVIHDCASA